MEDKVFNRCTYCKTLAFCYKEKQGSWLCAKTVYRCFFCVGFIKTKKTTKLMTYGISEVYRVNIKFSTKEEYRKFNDWRFDKGNEVYPCDRGGMSGNLRHLGYYDKETTEKIRYWMKENAGHFTPFLNQY